MERKNFLCPHATLISQGILCTLHVFYRELYKEAQKIYFGASGIALQ